MTSILGFSAFCPCASAALVCDGFLVHAEIEAARTGKTDDSSFPIHAIESCFAATGIGPSELDFVGFCGKPISDFGQKLEAFLQSAPREFGTFRNEMPLWLAQRLNIKRLFRQTTGGAFRRRMVFVRASEALAAGAFFTSPYHRSAILIAGGPEQSTGFSIWRGEDRRIETVSESARTATTPEMSKIAAERLARTVISATGLDLLCLAGWSPHVAKVAKPLADAGVFNAIWEAPARNGLGGAIGTAMLINHQLLGGDRRSGPCPIDLAPSGLDLGEGDAEAFALSVDAEHESFGETRDLIEIVASEITSGSIIGWFQTSEGGGWSNPGRRLIIGDAANSDSNRRINAGVLFREPEIELPVIGVRSASETAWSSQLNTRRLFDPDVDERLYRLIEAVARTSGSPVVTATELRLGREPEVRTMSEAYRVMMKSDLDMLVLDRCILRRPKQPPAPGIGPSGFAVEGAGDSFLMSPCCGSELVPSGTCVRCSECDHLFQKQGNIPLLFWPHETMGSSADVTEKVRAFYEETPFPDYDDDESLGSLIEKSEKGLYARELDAAIPLDSTVLEVGCGTGQLTNFLGISFRRVVGTDMCLNSLNLGEGFRSAHRLERVQFVQMNLFRPAFRKDQFDVVLCNGVLHHTADPRAGFAALVPLIRPGGFLVVGLYHRWGRLANRFRRRLFKLTGGRGQWLDPVLRRTVEAPQKRSAWYEDQYRHPHESTHTYDEVLGWFRDHGISFVRAIPAARPTDRFQCGDSLFDQQNPGRWTERLIAQSAQVVSGSKEGGFFVMIGRRLSGSSL